MFKADRKARKITFFCKYISNLYMVTRKTAKKCEKMLYKYLK